jgi:hypothetical protein
LEGLSLTCRKAQLDLLAEVCAQRRPARVALTGPTERRIITNTYFVAVDQNELLLKWPPRGVGGDVANDAAADVYFGHGGDRLAFRSRTLGQIWRTSCSRGAIPLWRLAVPLCIERKQQRAHPRLSLASLDPITAHFTNVADPDCVFTARLTNVSDGGLGCTAPMAAAGAIRSGNLYWTEFNLPCEQGRFEFVVRLTHTQEVQQHKTVLLGCMFCHGEDPLAYRAQLHRMERFVTTDRLTQPGGVNPREAEGGD